VNVTVENLGSCKKLVRFELNATEVDAALDTVKNDFQRHAALPGFRAGKAPRDMVLKRFGEEIKEEAKRKLISETYKSGIKEQKLNVINCLDVEEVTFEPGQPMTFVATVEIEPEFEVPEYRGLPAKREITTVTDNDLARALDALRGEQAKFEKVDRAVENGDFVVVNYSGTCEGKPITELAPAARGLTEAKNFWIEVKPGGFMPGFTEQLLGAKAGDKRTVTVDFPADFVTPQVASKQGVYEVEVTEVKQRVLPELNDAFAQSYGAENLEKLREGVRSDLQNELNLKQKKSVRGQLVRQLLDRVQFDLPESFVQHETRNVVYDIVSENQKRGISREIIDKQKEEIYSAASQNARERVKVGFLFRRIAEKEGVRVTPEQLNARIAALARANEMPAEKYFKELEKHNAVQDIVQQLLNERVVDFLQEHARIEDAAPVASPS
jgi:trigger factor